MELEWLEGLEELERLETQTFKRGRSPLQQSNADAKSLFFKQTFTRLYLPSITQSFYHSDQF